MIIGIWNCQLRDELIERALGGDAAAQRLLWAALPQNMPPAVRKAERDHRIRELGARLAAALPQAGPTRLSAIIAAAGARLERGRGLTGEDFDGLDTMEKADIETTVTRILAWTSPRNDGSRWLRERQILSILNS